MIDGLRPYPEMKATGLPWLPELPTAWEIHRAKYSFREADDRSAQGDEELLSVSHKTGVTPRSQKNITMFMAESYEGHKVCRPGDIVVNTMWAWMAALGVSRHVGIVSPAYGIYRPRSITQFEPRYLDYLLRTEAYRAEYLRSSRGVTTSRLRLYPPDFLKIPFVQPLLDEQRLIVRFLDWHGAQAAKLIRAKKKLIALLNEQKQAIIHRAVTRGLDPNVKLKPSGIPWIGDVPEGWAIRKIRHCGKIFGGMTPSMENRDFWDGGVPWVTPKDMKRRAIADSLMHVSAEALEKTSLRLIEPGAILMVVRGMILVRHIPVARTTAAVTINQDMKAIIPENSIQAEFFCHVLASSQPALSSLIDESGHGTRRFPTERWREMAFGFPPLAGQIRISDWIDCASRRENHAIESAEREVAFLLEFRTRLVADVVTGKLDVRAAAANLPKSTELEFIDELSDGDDPEETMDDIVDEEVAA